jgi:hypothetical protein
MRPTTIIDHPKHQSTKASQNKEEKSAANKEARERKREIEKEPRRIQTAKQVRSLSSSVPRGGCYRELCFFDQVRHSSERRVKLRKDKN